ncbi:winged helix-turn-helix domain-containing protein [Streptomyces sp. NPDC007162]|uniref:winged helix-turn-helix domain-containing protein n=1 Tax=Streptomyces sp. NPDC007162 TaxID=3156917 RepID=UPI0033C616E4
MTEKWYVRDVANRANDGRGAVQRVSEELRLRLSDGAYPLNSYLPSQESLATEFRVSRDTVQQALRVLRTEGWIESRQGKAPGSCGAGTSSRPCPGPPAPAIR